MLIAEQIDGGSDVVYRAGVLLFALLLLMHLWSPDLSEGAPHPTGVTAMKVESRPPQQASSLPETVVHSRLLAAPRFSAIAGDQVAKPKSRGTYKKLMAAFAR